MKRTILAGVVFTALLLGPAMAIADTRVAIGSLGLSRNGPDGDLADLVAARLTAAPGLALVERREMDKVLQEAGLGASGLVRAGDAVKIGGLLHVDQFLLGSSAPINGTNRLVLRLVDARTGVIRAVDVFPASGAMDALAGRVADFVRTESQRPAEDHHDYLTVGVVQNLGVNDRFPDFPAQLRGAVTTKLHGKVTVLERDVVSFLANEVQLDMAGLTATNGQAPAKMQMAFWIVDGFYQSYEVNGPEVQLRLRVERMQGGQQVFLLKGKLGEEFLSKVSGTVIQALAEPAKFSSATSESKKTEIEALEQRGAQLVDYGRLRTFKMLGAIRINDRENREKAISSLDEATRAYESILLLDPDNNAAKLRLAACLWFDTAYWIQGYVKDDQEQRKARAQELCREVIAAGTPEEANDARMDLACSIGGVAGMRVMHRFLAEIDVPEQKQQADFLWHEMYWDALAHASVEELLPDIREHMLQILAEVKANPGPSPKVDFGGLQGPLGCYDMYRDRAQFVMNKLVPEFIEKYPELEPYLLLAAASEQLDTNSPVIPRFLETLKRCEEHPESVWHPEGFFTHLSTTREEEQVEEAGRERDSMAYFRAFASRHHGLVVALALSRQRAAERGLAPPLTDKARLVLAQTYAAQGQWQAAKDLYDHLPKVAPELLNDARQHLGQATQFEDVPDSEWNQKPDDDRVVLAYKCAERGQYATAVKIMDSMEHRTVDIAHHSSGPWGNAFAPVLPAVVADGWRTKAGLPAVTDPIRFEVGETPYVGFTRDGYPRIYAIQNEGDNLWMAMYSQIKWFQGDGPFMAGSPKKQYDFPRTTQSGASCICVGSNQVWVGTFDDGLIELDRETGKCRRFTMDDGLLVNGIAALKLQGSTLWISYQNRETGGIGTMDVNNHKLSTLTPEINPGPAEVNHQPPNVPVSAMVEADPGQMWFAMHDRGIQRHRTGTAEWDTFFQGMSPYIRFHGLAADPKRGLLLAAMGSFNSDGGGLLVCDYRGSRLGVIDRGISLPSEEVTTVAVDGGPYAWVAGKGFIAVANLDTYEMVRVAYISADRIAGICLGPKYAYIQLGMCEGPGGIEYNGTTLNGVYRVERAAVEPPVTVASKKGPGAIISSTAPSP